MIRQLRLEELDVLDPERTGLVAFDLLEMYRPAIEAAGTLPRVSLLLDLVRRYEVPVFFARADHRADGRDAAVCASDLDINFVPWSAENRPITRHPHAAGEAEMAVLRELEWHDRDYDLPKHRWNAFHQTHLDLSLRTRNIDTILLVGGSTHVGIASTAFAGRDLDYHVVVVRDACHGFEEQRAFFMDKVFPRMCRVRDVAEVDAMLRRGAST